MTTSPPHLPTQYVPGEGRDHMAACLERAFEASVDLGIAKIIIFTGTGEGPLYAVQNLLTRPQFSTLQVIAVTPPVGRPYKLDPRVDGSRVVLAGVSVELGDLLSEFGIPVLAAHLPFKGIQTPDGRVSEWCRVAEALEILGGGFPLCVQAILVACDAGLVGVGERVTAVTADTALSALAARTESFLSPTEGLVVEHIFCRPARYDISRPKHQYMDCLWGNKPDPSSGE